MNYYTRYQGGRKGRLQYAQIPVKAISAPITLPDSAYRARVSTSTPLRYWEWLDREWHPELWQQVKTLYRQNAWPKEVCAVIAHDRPRSRANSALAVSWWQQNRALLLYALLTRHCPISELATSYVGLQDETMFYRYISQQWGLHFRCCDPPQLHRQYVEGAGFVEGRISWDSHFGAYKLVSAKNRAHLLQWSPNRGFYPLDHLQGDVRFDHLCHLDPHITPAQLLRDVTAFCYDAGLPLPQYDVKGVLRVDERVITEVYGVMPQTAKASANVCGCQYFDDATLTCGLTPRKKLERCEDFYPLEVADAA